MTSVLERPRGAPGARQYTLHELDLLDDPESYDLVDGRLEKLELGARSNEVALRFAFLLGTYLRAGARGVIIPPETGLAIFNSVRRLRRPDGGFLRPGRLERDELPGGNLEIVPDMVLEVVSPRDNAEKLERKLREYVAVGIPLVWVIYPQSRSVRVINGSHEETAGIGDTLDGGEIIPGFRPAVVELFEKPFA